MKLFGYKMGTDRCLGQAQVIPCQDYKRSCPQDEASPAHGWSFNSDGARARVEKPFQRRFHLRTGVRRHSHVKHLARLVPAKADLVQSCTALGASGFESGF